jgi:acid phosphatase family membrane protein YuiD
MATRSGMIYGLGSFEFAVTVMLAIIVMHDAMGVRLETGKQAKAINEMMELLKTLGQDITNEEKLKEFVGHTPSQVVAGAILGIVIALLLP